MQLYSCQGNVQSAKHFCEKSVFCTEQILGKVGKITKSVLYRKQISGKNVQSAKHFEKGESRKKNA